GAGESATAPGRVAVGIGLISCPGGNHIFKLSKLTQVAGSAKVPAKKPKLPRVSESSLTEARASPLAQIVISGPKAETFRILSALPWLIFSEGVQSTKVTHCPSTNLLNK